MGPSRRTVLHYQDPNIPVLWQIFSGYGYLAGWIYRRFANVALPPSTTSVTKASRFIVFASFLTLTYFHLTTLRPLLVSGDAESSQQLFLLAYYFSPSSVNSSAIAFLQYDFYFAWILAWLVTLLTVRLVGVRYGPKGRLQGAKLRIHDTQE